MSKRRPLPHSAFALDRPEEIEAWAEFKRNEAERIAGIQALSPHAKPKCPNRLLDPFGVHKAPCFVRIETALKLGIITATR